VGAALYRALSIWIINHTDYSRLALGLLIVALAILFPKGIVGAFESWRLSRRPQSGGAS
jgi:branched-chain amino acid transport system permease protein